MRLWRAGMRPLREPCPHCRYPCRGWRPGADFHSWEKDMTKPVHWQLDAKGGEWLPWLFERWLWERGARALGGFKMSAQWKKLMKRAASPIEAWSLLEHEHRTGGSRPNLLEHHLRASTNAPFFRSIVLLEQMNYAIRYGADPDFPAAFTTYFSASYKWARTPPDVFKKKTQGILYLSSNVSGGRHLFR